MGMKVQRMFGSMLLVGNLLAAAWSFADEPAAAAPVVETVPTAPAPAESTPAPAEPTPAPAEPTPAPAEPTPAPAEPTPAPAEPTSAPAEPTSSPAEPTSSPAVEAPTSVAVYPSEVFLHHHRDRQSLVVQATYASGITRDVTGEATFTFAQPELVEFKDWTIWPKADGQSSVTIAFGGQSLVVPVTITGSSNDPAISFQLDVMPVFMRTGCNTGSCHGAARGKDGFRLSLFGFDPNGDHYRLTREIATRRLNLAVPETCLFMEKAMGKVQHTGGKRIEEGTELHATLLRWLKEGANNDGAEIPKPMSLEILPKNAVLEQGDKHRLTVRAKYSDGTDRDVTGLALFLSNNEGSAAIDTNGAVLAGQRGEAFVMARFATFTVGSQVIVIPKNLQYQWPSVPENNYIDTLVHAKLRKLRMIPSELCSDEEFLRRVSIDVVGQLPTAADYEKFMTSTDPEKRAKLVDELLTRKEFAEIWVMKFAELLQIRTTLEVSYKSMLLYFNWLQDKIASNTPMNVIVQELLSANGGTFKSPATNYYQIEKDTLKVSENVAQVFMGMRIQCAQCHNHPFDRWTMNDYYAFANFFSQIGRKGSEDPRELVIFNSGGGEVNHLVTGQPLPPKFLGGAVPDVAGKDRRKVLADWLASPENPYFARNLANIVWDHFMGLGIIDPVDDVRVSNPASNPELLDELAAKFTSYNYDFRKLVRDICTSRAYQLSTKRNETNELDERNFAHGQVRRIRAEVMLDVITQVTETKNKFAGLPLGARAVQIADGNVSSYFLQTFGRATRASVCSCEVKMDPNLSQALHLLNGETTTQRIAEGKLIDRLLSEGRSPESIVDELYVRCFSRKPTDVERAKIAEGLAGAPDKSLALQDVFWAILNTREFMFNH
jgi:hypothetical protein